MSKSPGVRGTERRWVRGELRLLYRSLEVSEGPSGSPGKPGTLREQYTGHIFHFAFSRHSFSVHIMKTLD